MLQQYETTQKTMCMSRRTVSDPQ